MYQIADISSCFDKNEKMDAVWTAFDKLKDEDGEVYLRELAVVLCGILTIPHSNAHYERIFSTVWKNRTEQRASLGDDILEAQPLLKKSARTRIWHQSLTFNSRTQKAEECLLWGKQAVNKLCCFLLYGSMAMICKVGDSMLRLGHSVPLIYTVEHSLRHWGTIFCCLVVQVVDTYAC